jgi:FlaA1/EpsC-like NDP-sugar epimerase
MDLILAFFALSGVRMGLRLLREGSSECLPSSPEKPVRTAIIGTGRLATRLALDFIRSKHPPRRVVAFFDDDPYAWHKNPYDIPVIGMPECLLNPEWHEKLDEIIVALPGASPARLHEIRDLMGNLPLKATFVSDWPLVSEVGA